MDTEPFHDRQAWRIFLEDLLVSRTRFSWARHRHMRGRRLARSRAAKSDLAAHRSELERTRRLFGEAGGETKGEKKDRTLARSLARDRLRNDASQARCLCPSNDCGRTLPPVVVANETARMARTVPSASTTRPSKLRSN